MKKKSILLAVPIFLLFIAFIGYITYELATDPWIRNIEDRTEYPLKSVDVQDNSNYMLVKWQHSPTEKYEVITDTQAIKANISTFSVENEGEIYGTTSDGLIWLYKDGKQTDSVAFDNTYTKNIEYGTLEFQQVNQLQYQLLIGSKIIEQGENYSVLCDDRDEKSLLYYSFAHGEDLKDIDTVYLLSYTSDINELAKPQIINEDIITFIEHSTNYSVNQTRHWFFRLSDCELSSYRGIRAIKDNLVVYSASYMEGGKSRIIIHDMFDKSIDYNEITGDFPDPRNDDFLLAAEFTADGNLKAEYIGNDGQVHKDVFSMD